MDDDIRSRLETQQYCDAFELILERYKNKVFRLAYSMLHDPTQAEDSTQDVFVRIWKGLPGYHGGASLSTWIYAIARNTCLTALRSAPAPLSLEEPGVRMAAEARRETPREAPGAPDLEYLVSRLPEKYRRVIALYYMEEKSYEEVARMLDLPMGTVKAHLHRAKKELAAAVMGSRMTGGTR
jgi:RNA polymerase sigma-70 factor (ECF subfamily)